MTVGPDTDLLLEKAGQGDDQRRNSCWRVTAAGCTVWSPDIWIDAWRPAWTRPTRCRKPSPTGWPSWVAKLSAEGE